MTSRAISMGRWLMIATAFGCVQLAFGRAAIGCHTGSYRLADGTLVDISPPHPDGNLRWRRFDGRTGELHRRGDGRWIGTLGWTDRADGTSVRFGSCNSGTIEFDGISGKRLPFEVQGATFISHDTALAGRLVMPSGKGRLPVVVLVAGSEHSSELDTYYLQRMLPAEGVGVFVYDKRGTGRSGGHYTQDFSLLADDAVAAVREARRLAGRRLDRIGLQGSSEGGWVAPLAALRTHVDFVIVCYGLAVSILQEDQESVALQLHDRGFSGPDIARALALAAAAENLAASGFARGFRTLDALRVRYERAPWYRYVRGDFTWMLLSRSDAQLRRLGRKLNPWQVPFYYNPMPVLMADPVPQLWIVGGQDFKAPGDVTSRRITHLISMGKPFTLACYPNASHQMVLFETGSNGDRAYIRYAPGYFSMMRDYILHGRLSGEYGNATITRPSSAVGASRRIAPPARSAICPRPASVRRFIGSGCAC